VLHATPEWSLANLERDAAEVADMLVQEACALPGARRMAAGFATAHRWRHALAKQPLERGALWFDRERLALAGDWCAGSRVEGAFLSGAAAAGRVLGCDYARTAPHDA
jgi:predicted NAD/FAD-dependent oxidoreductase